MRSVNLTFKKDNKWPKKKVRKRPSENKEIKIPKHFFMHGSQVFKTQDQSTLFQWPVTRHIETNIFLIFSLHNWYNWYNWYNKTIKNKFSDLKGKVTFNGV